MTDPDALPLAIAKACGIPTDRLVKLSAWFEVGELPRITATYWVPGANTDDIETITEQWTPEAKEPT